MSKIELDEFHGMGEAKKKGSMKSQSSSVSETVPKKGLRTGKYTTARTVRTFQTDVEP